MFSAAWFICKDLFRLLTHSTNIWPRVSSAVVFCFFLFTFFIIIIVIFFVALRCRLLHLASRASITPGSLTTTTGPGHVAMLQTQPALAPNALFAPYTTCCHALYGASFAQPQYAFLLFPLFTTAPACPVKVNNANATRCDPLRFVAMRCLSGLNNLQSRLSMSANHRNTNSCCASRA